MIKFLPSYVGSKSYWVGRLDFLQGRQIIEPFAGSGVLSANYASSCVLNDYDPYMYRVLSRFDDLIVPDLFTPDMYFDVRSRSDWWRWAYCLQRMSFSGVFRWSKNGYNVPIKKSKGVFPVPVDLRSDYATALSRWQELHPTVTNLDYREVRIIPSDLIICDPPYELSQASYNSTKFNYGEEGGYWDWVLSHDNDLVVFDRLDNIMQWTSCIYGIRNMRVTGHYKGGLEAVSVRLNGEWLPGVTNVTIDNVTEAA